MPVWKWVICGPAPSTTERRELATAYGRRITFRLDGSTDAQFSMNGQSQEVTEVLELQTDVIIYRTNTITGNLDKLYRGRIITETDQVNPDNHTCQFSSIAYRGMLNKRFVNTPVTFTATDVGTLTYSLISTSQALTGGNWGITNGLGSSAGATVTKDYGVGHNIHEAISALGHATAGGFEWDIDANLAFNRYYPTRGSATGAILDYGGTVSNIRKNLSSGDFANADILTGSDKTTPIVVASATVGSDPQGRWEQYISDIYLQTQAELTLRGDWTIALTSKLRPVFTVTLANDRWDPTTMWLGDTITLVAKINRLSVNALYRILEINCSIDENGVETIQLGLTVA